MERPPLRRSLLIAMFVAVTWAAATFAVAGLLAVLLDRDPVQTPLPLYAGLVGLALAGIVVWLAVAFTTRARTPWIGALAAGAVVYLLISAVALMTSFPLFVEQASSPFVIAGAVLAAIAVVATWGVLRRPPNAGLSRGRPSS
ncbi:MAG: hypothetical protein ABI435_09035 [Pseudolysinimonas sp.]